MAVSSVRLEYMTCRWDEEAASKEYRVLGWAAARSSCFAAADTAAARGPTVPVAVSVVRSSVAVAEHMPVAVAMAASEMARAVVARALVCVVVEVDLDP